MMSLSALEILDLAGWHLGASVVKDGIFALKFTLLRFGNNKVHYVNWCVLFVTPFL